MKPVVTWIVLANARRAYVVANRGPGKGLAAVEGNLWHAEPASEHADRAGVGHSIAGPGVTAVEQGDSQHYADTKFAKEIVAHLAKALSRQRFDRLVIVAGPHMLGLMRDALTGPLNDVLIAEVSKDLSALPIERLETHLGDVIAV